MPQQKIANRRTVRGLAFRVCDFCGREHAGKDGTFNYQYFNESRQDWDKHVFCSKACSSAYYTINGDD